MAKREYEQLALKLNAKVQAEVAPTVSHQALGASPAIGVKAPRHSPRGRHGGPQTGHHQGNRSEGQYASQAVNHSLQSQQLYQDKP